MTTETHGTHNPRPEQQTRASQQLHQHYQNQHPAIRAIKRWQAKSRGRRRLLVVVLAPLLVVAEVGQGMADGLDNAIETIGELWRGGAK